MAAEGQRGGVKFLADALVNGVVGHDKSALAGGQKIASGGDGGVRAVPVVPPRLPLGGVPEIGDSDGMAAGED